ncbi:cytochrome P450 [Streptomyces sp. NBC_00091]|uniref:cytochrome P450 n=1 Tax=Streptomyces sp. NBC_00091 TaxID=2975648 RepID=UPI0022505E63|nr:cytochrome P450 [Streptomyces sp. NBC_00091]MCX5381593.1 cytochrome P450 [Streptomyces sp. NBC_00091]
MLAHGAAGSAAANFGPLIAGLARHHTVIAPDYPGSGGVPLPPGPLELDALADRLAEAAAEAGHDRFSVVGYSLGVPVAVRAAARHRRRVRSLVLTAGFAVPDPHLRLTLDLWRHLAAAGEHDALARLFLLLGLDPGDLARLTPPALAEAAGAVAAAVNPGILAQADLVARADVRADLPGLDLPTLVVATAHDRLVLPVNSERLAAAVPGARLASLPCGHFIGGPHFAAWETLVREFLDRPDPTEVARQVRHFDHHSPEFTPDLAHAVHDALREAGPVAHTPAHGGLHLLTRHADVQAAMKDHTLFTSGSGVFCPRAPGTPYFAPLEYDPPLHTAYRNLMKPSFSRAAVESLRPRIDALVASLIRPLARAGGGDLVERVAVPLPLAALGLAVGFSEEAQGHIRALTRTTWERMPKDAGPDGFWPAFSALFDREIRRARDEPGDDHLSALVRADFDGRPVTDEELHVMLVSFAVAGHETTMNALAHLMWNLARDPELDRRLRAAPELIPDAVEETLRLWPPVDHGSRLTSRDTTIAGTEVPAGSRVLLLTGAANHDPAVFDAPCSFRLGRDGAGRHLSLGYGIHFCLGAHLARAELVSVLTELLRHPPLRQCGPATRRYENGRHVGFDQLPVTLSPRNPSASLRTTPPGR